MSSYLSSLSTILTNTTSKYNNLRRTLLSDESDGDTEDDSHVSRVLRAYYTEKARPFPQWLPPDPKATQFLPQQYAQPGRPAVMPGQPRRGGGLNDLWATSDQQNQPPAPTSLRQPRSTGGQLPSQQIRRPLINSRESSQQSQASGRGSGEESRLTQVSSTGSAQDRLKARLYGARSSSPSQSSSNPYGRSSNY